jgi:hypothetical protein
MFIYHVSQCPVQAQADRQRDQKDCLETMAQVLSYVPAVNLRSIFGASVGLLIDQVIFLCRSRACNINRYQILTFFSPQMCGLVFCVNSDCQSEICASVATSSSTFGQYPCIDSSDGRVARSFDTTVARIISPTGILLNCLHWAFVSGQSVP